MSILTISVYPATRDGHFTSVEITRRLEDHTVEIKAAADCTAAVERIAAAVQGKYPHGVQVSGFIRPHHGRKPNGYKALDLTRFVETAQAVAA